MKTLKFLLMGLVFVLTVLACAPIPEVVYVSCEVDNQCPDGYLCTDTGSTYECLKECHDDPGVCGDGCCTNVNCDDAWVCVSKTYCDSP